MTVVSVLPFGETAARLGAATVAGAMLGINRNLHGKAAGMRTHALVALGAALVTAAACGADPAGATRVMQGVITGIGFIGAGVILHPRPPAVSVRPATGAGDAAGGTVVRTPRPRRPREVQGLTTAANVWVAAGLGLAAGLGAWAIVLTGTVFTLAILSGGGQVERGIQRQLLRRLRRRRALRRHALEHDHRAGDGVRVGERDVRARDA